MVGNGDTEASPREIHAAQDPYNVVLARPFESCTPPVVRESLWIKYPRCNHISY